MSDPVESAGLALAQRLRGYLRGGDLHADAVAGLTVAVMGVPQAMAYALIAGLPPVYGLYTAIVTCAVAALIGSSRHLVTGPTNALCMVVLSLTAHLPDKYPGVSLIECVLLLTLMTGTIQMAFGLLRFGGIVRYVSNSVVVGFTAGAGILIAVNQLKNILGVEIPEAHAERSYEVLYATATHVLETNPYALGIGTFTAVVVIFAPKLHRRLPGALLGIVVAGVACWVFGWHEAGMGAFRVEIVRDIEPIRGGLPALHVPQKLLHPNYDLTRELGTGALALAILGLVEAASIARAVAASSGQRIDFTREFVGQGVSNMVGSLFYCFAGSGSFTRTAVCHQSGGRTRMAAMFSAVFTALALLLLGPVANQIPKAALAGILVVIAYSMIEKHRLGLAWRSGQSSRLVLVGTLGSTLVLPLEYAVFIGVFLSLLIVLRTTGKTDLTQLVPHEASGFEELPFTRAAPSPVVTVNLEGDLYLAAADDLDYELLKCVTPQTRVMVLRMKRLRAVGSTAMAMLEHFWQVLKNRDIHLVVCGIEDELEKVLTGSGLREQIGEQNIFYADNKLFQSTELALARAWSIVDAARRALARRAGADPVARPSERITAGDMMSPRAIRFGDQHQLREAVWLMSELHKHTKSISPEPLFLQDREARLGGELSPWRLLEALAAGANGDGEELDDHALAERFRRDFTKSIGLIARADLVRLRTDTPLARLIEFAVAQNLQVIPVCDADGRIKGLVSNDTMLTSLEAALARDDDGEGADG